MGKVGHILSRKLSPNTWLVWSSIGLLVAADAIGLKIEGMSFSLHAFKMDLITVAVLLALSFFFTYFHSGAYSAHIADMMHAGAAFLIFTAIAVVSSYLITAAWHSAPLVDEYLAVADRSLGIDWPASYKWVAARPLVHKALWFGYNSVTLQITALLMIMCLRRSSERSWEMLWLFVIACTACILLSGPWPAVGAFGYHHLEINNAYVRAFMALRDGSLRSIGETDVQGIVQFPSFHVALGIFLVYVTRGIPLLFIISLELNILLFLSTPAIGGHHFADLWGGIVLAAATIFVLKTISRRGALQPQTVKESGVLR